MITQTIILEQAEIFCEEPIDFDSLGLVGSKIPNTLTYLDDRRFIEQARSNLNITVVLTTAAIAKDLTDCTFKIVICADPRYSFFKLYNIFAEQKYIQWKSEIHATSHIHSSSSISPNNVRIGARTIVEPNVTILRDVIIGEDCIIRAGSVVGSEGFEYKRTSKGILSVHHDRIVKIGDRVYLGANNTVSKGIMNRDTIIDDDTKLDNLVHIAHGSQLGKRCLLAAGAIIAGSVTMGNDVWVGPNSTISNLLEIGDGASITLGSVVTKNVPSKSKVTGNFAISHEKFLENLKKAII